MPARPCSITSHDHEVLIQRTKVGQDNASPAGNGIAAQALQRLAVLSGNTKYADAAERCLKLFLPALEQAGSYHTSLCTALAEHLQPANLLVLNGKSNDLLSWQDALRGLYLPDVMIFCAPQIDTDLPEVLRKPVSQTTTAWLCQGTQCLPPIILLSELLDTLKVSNSA